MVILRSAPCCHLSFAPGLPLRTLVEANTGRWCAVPSAFTGSYTDDVRVDGAGYAVDDLDVELGEDILLVDGCLGNVSDRSRLDHVSDGESVEGGHA